MPPEEVLDIFPGSMSLQMQNLCNEYARVDRLIEELIDHHGSSDQNKKELEIKLQRLRKVLSFRNRPFARWRLLFLYQEFTTILVELIPYYDTRRVEELFYRVKGDKAQIATDASGNKLYKLDSNTYAENIDQLKSKLCAELKLVYSKTTKMVWMAGIRRRVLVILSLFFIVSAIVLYCQFQSIPIIPLDYWRTYNSNPEIWLVCGLLGFLSATISAMVRQVDVIDIDERQDPSDQFEPFSYIVNFIRPLIGFVAGVLAYLLMFTDIVTVQSTSLALLFVFFAGFSERLFINRLAKIMNERWGK